jgi:hypothetical protein
MTVAVSFNETDRIIEVKIDESFSWQVIEKAVPQIANFVIEKNNQRVLLDFRSAAITLSTVQIYMTPDKLAEEFSKFGVDIRSLRRALLLFKEDRDYHFLETAIINKFQTFRTFFDEDEARTWLKE